MLEGVVVQWCNPLTLQPEKSGGVVSKPGRFPPNPVGPQLFLLATVGAKFRNFTVTLTILCFLHGEGFCQISHQAIFAYALASLLKPALERKNIAHSKTLF